MARFYLSPSRIARYYFHECDRHLRYAATPKERKAEEGVPQYELDFSLVTRAILQGGYDWEARVIAEHLPGGVIVAHGDDQQPTHERRHSIDDSVAALARMQHGEFLYQPTLRPPPGFYEEYGIDPALVQFVDCYPDLLAVDGDDGPEVAVIDVKASDLMKLSHRIQVALYSLILGHVLKDAGVALPVAKQGGVWLFEQAEPEWFDLVHIVPPLETFLTGDVTRILSAPAEDAFWHVYFRCEWCDFDHHCRTEAEGSDDISLVPYLSTFGKRHLNEQMIGTVEELGAALQSPDRAQLLAGCASLEGRERHLSLAVESLRAGGELATGASSIAMPKGEQVRLVLTLQSEPMSGQLYGYAINRVFGKDLFGAGTETIARVASTGDPQVLVAFRRQLVCDLIGILQPVHDHNVANTDDWWSQKSVQGYVFDTYERGLLTEALLAAVLDPEVAEEALALLFYFQRPELSQAEDHPAEEVFFPLVVINQVVRSLFALPIPVTYRFADVVSALAPSQYAFDYRGDDFFSFELSNRMKSNAILEVWQRGRSDLVESIERELKFRVWGANSVINGLKERLDGSPALFAWPPKFHLPESLGFRDPTLSRLAFIARYEQVLDYLDIRGGRTAPEDERIADEYTLRLTYEGDNHYRLDPAQIEAEAGLGDFANYLLTRDTEAGRKARLAFHDFQYRRAHWTPKTLDIALAAVVDRPAGDVLEIRLTVGRAFVPPAVGETVLLEPRFTDWNSMRVVEELAAIDGDEDPWFVHLVQDPLQARRRNRLPARVRRAVLVLGAEHGLTPSQADALTQVADHDVQLVWGPPGTGKTHFLAMTVLTMLEAHRRARRPMRVLLTAFTHTAIDNLLRKLEELQEQRSVVQAEFGLVKATTEISPVVTGIDPRDIAGYATQHELLVIGATVWQARKTPPESVAYDLVVIDEGSQLKVAEAAMAARRVGEGGRLVVAGDDLQLPPIVRGDYPMPEGEPPLHRSILECLRFGDPAGEMTSVLLENFRMNDVLCGYPAGRIYPEAYGPANDEVADRRLAAMAGSGDAFLDAVLDPDHPMVLCVLEDVKATARNPEEAALVADTVTALREHDSDDVVFWAERLFVVSPHHKQIRLIRRALADRRTWSVSPFVDTVDKMQGQERDAVIVSYGVSDVEYALQEKDFIYRLNRLNVSITRGRAKTIVFIPRPLLEPPIQALDQPEVADGVAYMQGLMHWLRDEGEVLELQPNGQRVTVYRK